MTFEEFFLWCLVMLPLLVTPGPANIAVASISASRGFRSAMLFAAGITLINCIAVSFMGMGMGLLYEKYQGAFHLIAKLGALYVIYLGYMMLRSHPEIKKTTHVKKLGFKDGVVLQLLNAKLYPTLAMMYSQFIDGETSAKSDVFLLGSLLVAVAGMNYVAWAGMGKALSHLRGKGAIWIQRYGFGGLLVGVGVWLLVY